MIFTFSFPVTLDLKFAHLVTTVQLYVSTKLEVSMTFWFREKNWRHGMDRQSDRQTDELQHLMWPPVRATCNKHTNVKHNLTQAGESKYRSTQ